MVQELWVLVLFITLLLSVHRRLSDLIHAIVVRRPDEAVRSVAELA